MWIGIGGERRRGDGKGREKQEERNTDGSLIDVRKYCNADGRCSQANTRLLYVYESETDGETKSETYMKTAK